MSDGAVPFVTKAVEYAEDNAAFVPAFVDVAELKKDVAAVNTPIVAPGGRHSESAG